MSKTGRKPNDRSPEAQAQRQKAAIRLTEIKSQWVNAHKTADNKRGALVSEFAARLAVGESTLRGYCSEHCTHNLPDDLAKKLAEIWKELTGEITIPEYWQGKTDQKDLDGYASERKSSQIHHELSAFDEASRQTASMQSSLFGQFGVSCITAKPGINALRTSDVNAISDCDIEAISEEQIKVVLCSGKFGASFTKEEIEDLKRNIRRTILGWIADKMSMGV